MDFHLGYEANDHGYKDTDNRRNGYIHKEVKTTYGGVPVDVPRDRDATFEPQAIPKRTRDVSGIEDKVFNYGSAVRKVMYTTNAIEAVNSSFRKVTKKGSFPSEDAVRKALYLRITELYKKWNGRPVSNWALVRNQLAMDDKMQARIRRYENF